MDESSQKRDPGKVDLAEVDALFEELLDLAPPERARRLAEIGTQDTVVAKELGKLITLADEPETEPIEARVESLVDGLLLARESEAEPAEAPASVGPWKLVRELGRGGMGTVYLGQRADGEFQQEAAIKLIHVGDQDPDTLRRFELERQILAGLSHPNIARLLDGGRTADGQPYFAMEFVRGHEIRRHADDGRLTVRQRLELFLQVARAVQHAHRSLVVHRDLKPGNIVVTEDGKVKLLDFGIAKLLGPRPLGGDSPTGTLFRVLTPEYASPEQIRGQPITTASDVYQLGLLLYELLTGHHAHALETRTLGDLERAVCEKEPTRPSTQVTSAKADPSTAWARNTQPHALAKKLRGDLDNIVLLALRKEPEKRYASVSQLIDDVERYLEGLPVSARAPTFSYRAGKFLTRHALPVAAGGAFLALLIGYAVTTTVQAGQIRAERDRAELEAARARKVRDFLVGTFEAADPYRNLGDELTAGALLVAGSEAARDELADEPEILSEMLGTLGEASASLGAYERAQNLYQESHDLALEAFEPPHPEIARARIRLASVLRERGDLDRSAQLAETALAELEELYPEGHPSLASGLAAVAGSKLYLGEAEAAEELYRQEVALREASGEPDVHLARALNDLGACLKRRGAHAEAEQMHRRALALRRFLLPEGDPAISASLNNLAAALRASGKAEEAEPLYREALATRRQVFGDRHVRVSNTLNNIGELHRSLGQYEEAEAAHLEALSIRREILGGGHSNVAMSLHNLGVVYRDSGQPELAEENLKAALALFRQALPPGHSIVPHSLATVGGFLRRQGRPDSASPYLEESLELRRSSLGEDHPRTAEARVALGLCRVEQGRRAEGEAALREGLGQLEGAELPPRDPALIEEAHQTLAGLTMTGPTTP